MPNCWTRFIWSWMFTNTVWCAHLIIFILYFNITGSGLNTDFLGWSFKNEEEIVSCLTALTSSNSAADEASLYHPAGQSPLRWLEILRSQFIQVGLCTIGSVSQLENQPQSGRESMKEDEGKMSSLNKGQERLLDKERIKRRSNNNSPLVSSILNHLQQRWNMMWTNLWK